jgi:acyl-CoA reductase-like NAD-dependent aldehyde dehydrogenase
VKTDSSTVLSKIDGHKLGQVEFLRYEDIEVFLGSENTFRNQHLINSLRDFIALEKDTIAKLLVHEIGKPITQANAEIQSCLELLETSMLEYSKQDTKDLLIIGSIARPLWEMCAGLIEFLPNYRKIVYKPSTKAAVTVSFIYKELCKRQPEIAGKFLVVNIEKEVLDDILLKDVFNKIVKYGKSKLKPKLSYYEDRGLKDRVMVVDSSSDLEMCSAKIIDNVLLFESFNESRIQHIFIESSVQNSFIEKLSNKFNWALNSGSPDVLEVNFYDTFKTYKRDNLKKKVLETLSLGADIIYGSIGDAIDKPLVIKCDLAMVEEYKQNYWAPVIFLIAYRDIMNLLPILKNFPDHSLIAFTNQTNSDFLKKRVRLEITNY